MDSVTAFFEMGGYGGFVWPAYVFAAVVLIGLLVSSIKSLHDRQAELRAIQSGERRVPTARHGVAREA